MCLPWPIHGYRGPRDGFINIKDMCHMRRRIHVSYEEEDTCVSLGPFMVTVGRGMVSLI